MDKKTFRLVCKIADDKIAILNEQKKQSELMYIRRNCEFEKGDTVKITRKAKELKNLATGEVSIIPEYVRFAFVNAVYVDKEGDIKVQWNRCRQDLTRSTHHFNCWMYGQDGFEFEVVKKDDFGRIYEQYKYLQDVETKNHKNWLRGV